jgi:hypothetical protein
VIGNRRNPVVEIDLADGDPDVVVRLMVEAIAPGDRDQDA